MSENKLTSIPSIGSSGKKDRGAISVKGKEKKKADVGLFALIAFAILVPVVVLMVYISKMGGDDEVQVDPESIKTEAIVERNVSVNSGSFKTFIENVKRENEAEKLPVPPVVEEVPEVEIPPDVVEEEAKKVETQQQQVQAEKQGYDQVTMMRKLSVVMTPEIEKSNSSGVGTSILDAATQQMSFDTSLNSPKYENGSASVANRAIRDFLLTHGTNISCGLESEIISTHSGLVTCIVSSDVYSSNGRTLLVEKGSKAFGNQTVSLEQGQARVFVTWSDIQTTEGVRININSLGTGSLGASGVEAWVDNHFAERFGGAIMLSFLDDAFSALSNNASKQGIEAGESIDNAGSMAEIALENSVNIAPTAYVHIGKRLNIMVARDIDMSSVYGHQKIKRTRSR